MRIEQLSLLRYGCFTDVTLDFSAPGLHVVVGPNEAGKSTSRAAVGDLLFGFPARTPQAHIHATSDLCLSATVATRGGLLALERHKRKPYLREPDGTAMDNEIILRRSITRDVYEVLFAMGHEELREGAAELLRTRGDIGRVLFGVTAGRAGAAALLDRLQAEADEIFKPRAQKRGVMAAVGAHGYARERLSAAALPPATWSRAAEELRDVEASIADRQVERLRSAGELSSLKTLRVALPLLARRDQAVDALAQLVGANIPANDRERIALAFRELAEASDVERAAREELARLEVVPGAGADSVDVLAIEAEVVALQEQLGGFRQARLDLPAIEARAAVALEALRAAAARCGLDGDDALASPLPTAAVRAEALMVASELDEGRRQSVQAVAERRAAEHVRRRAHDAVASAPPPRDTSALMQRIAAARDALAERDRLAELAQRATDACGDQEKLRDTLATQAALPTTAELLALRCDRDARWRQIRAAWLSRAEYDAETADAFEAGLSDADDLADRRHRDAEASGRLAAIEEAVATAETERDAATAALATGVERAADAASALAAELALIDRVPVPVPDPAALIDLAEIALDDLQVTQSERARLEASLVDADASLERALEEERGASASLSEVTERWSRACVSLGLDAELSPTAVRAHLDALHELAAARADLVQVEADLAALRSRIDSFETGVAAISALVDPPPNGATPDEVAADLAVRLRNAVEERAVAAVTERRAAELADRAQAAATNRAIHLSALERLASRHGVDVTALADAAEVSARREALDAEIAEAERLLLETAAGASVAAVEELAAAQPATSATEIDTRIAAIETVLADLDSELDELHVRRGELRKTLDQWRGGDDAARAAAEMHETAASVGELATRYVRLRIAHEMLRREVDRNRERHQGPVLRRAAAHLGALTNSRYVDILDSPDDGAVLDVRRYDREVVGVERLSEGTRDQLWLALRLAALERWCEDREPFPLVLDDVCMTFDDERTAAALQLLAQLSDRLQVLFFTHHESVAATATRVVPAGRVHVHRLERFSPPVKQNAPGTVRAARKKRSPAA